VPSSSHSRESTQHQVFSKVLRDLVIESVRDPQYPEHLRLHFWDGRKATTAPTALHRKCLYTPAPIPDGLARAIRFPVPSQAFGTPTQLFGSISKFLEKYASLRSGTVEILAAFAVASWFVDCFPVTPTLQLLGPHFETGRALRLLGCLCRRPILLGDLDVVSISTLPSDLDPTLLIKQEKIGRRLTQVLHASSDRHFVVARGRGAIHAYGAKAIASAFEPSERLIVQLSLTPVQELRPIFTGADERRVANDFQAKLLRYRLVNRRDVSHVQIDVGDFVPAMREEVRAWLAPITNCPELCRTVRTFLLQLSRGSEKEVITDDRCVVAEGALAFCHTANIDHFLIAELAESVNDLLIGRHEDRILSSKKVGMLLRALGVNAQRMVKGYTVSLTENVRKQIHQIASAYRVASALDGVERCQYCRGREH
jgi:hypothetical protein